MLSLKIMMGLIPLLLMLVYPAVKANLDTSAKPHSCCYGNRTIQHGGLVDSIPIKCMQLFCNNGGIETRYFDKPEDCGCCEFNGKMYQNSERIGAICTDMTCCNRKWVTGGWLDNCCRLCNLKNDPHITTFDGYYYHWHGKCNYSISQLEFGYNETFGIYGQFRQCNDIATCIDITTFTDNPNTFIKVNFNGGPIIWVNSEPYEVENTVKVIDVGDGPHPVLAWRDGGCNMFLGSQGYLLKTCYSQVFVWAYPNLLKQVNGLCGHYNMYEPDDFTDRNGNQHPLVTHPTTFPKSWLTADQSKPGCVGPWTPSEDEDTEDGGAGDPCNADDNERKRLHEVCVALFLHVRWEGHAATEFILNIAIWSCVSDLCIMHQNDISITIIKEWKLEMVIMLEMNINIEIHTTEGALPWWPSEHSEQSEHSSEHRWPSEQSEYGEHSSCSESGGCNHAFHFKSNMNFQMEFGDGIH